MTREERVWAEVARHGLSPDGSPIWIVMADAFGPTEGGLIGIAVVRAALVVAEREVRRDERERCAKIAEASRPRGIARTASKNSCCYRAQEWVCEGVAEAIRRSE